MVTPYHTKSKIYNCDTFIRVQSSFLSSRGTLFPSQLFSTHFVHISGKPHLFSWERLDSCLYILRPDKQSGGKLMVKPFEIVSICVWLLVLFSETCRTAGYLYLHKQHMLRLHVTDECLEQFFVSFPTLLRMLMN